MKIFPTHMESYDDCPRKYWYKHIARWKKRAKSATLLIGILLHESVRKFLKADFDGTSYDPVSEFCASWSSTLANEEVEFNTKQTAEGLEATGKRILELFPQAWADMALVPIMDSDGQPFLERELETQITENVAIAARIDGIFMSKITGQVGPKDFKFPAQAFDPIATMQSDQLTIQQMVVEANAPRLALEGVDNVGFIEIIRRDIPKKQGKGPEVLPPSVVPARTSEQLREFKHKVIQMASDVERGRFHKTPRQAHNTPCTMCDFRNHCVHGSTAGLIIPPDKQIALPVAA